MKLKKSIKVPKKNCSLCPRIQKFRIDNIYKFPAWYNGSVNSFGSINSEVLIVGLAPGLKGANRTGRPFTGDYAGELLYPSLLKFKFADGLYNINKKDSLTLINTRITNSIRCVPPQNKPNKQEKDECRKFLISEIENMINLKIILALGKIAHEEILKIYNLTLSKYEFKHGNIHYLKNNIKLYDSYHCSRYNTQTNRLTFKMFHSVLKNIKTEIDSTNLTQFSR